MSTLNEAISEAVETLTKRIDPLGTKAVEETPVKEDDEQVEEDPSSEDEPKEDEPSGDEDLDEAALAEAKQLYKALLSPKSRRAVLVALADQEGLLGKNAPETKTEVKVAKKAITEIISDRLPDNMKFLAKDLGPAIEAVFEQEREEQNEKFQQIEIQKVEGQVVEITKRLNQETKGDYGKHESQILALIEEMPPASHVSMEKYLRNLYTIASSKGTSTRSSSRQIADKIRSNANDVTTRLRSGVNQNSKPSGEFIPPDKKITSKEAVRLALAHLQKG